MKTGHIEGDIALSAGRSAQGRDEPTQGEPAAFHHNFGDQLMVAPTHCPGTGCEPGDRRQVSPASGSKTGHFDPRL
jgi:hypothetical protein